MDFLTNREWAILVWLALIAAILSWNEGARKASVPVLQSLLSKHILWLLAALTVYVLTFIALFHGIGLWALEQTKTTAIWLLFAAPAACFRAATAEKHPNLFREWTQDTFKLTVIVEFIALDHPFSFPVELVLVPALAFIATLSAYAAIKQEHATVANLLNSILIIIGVFLVGRGLWFIFHNLGSYADISTARDIYTVPLLSLSLIPFAYALYLYAKYETALTPLRIFLPDRKLRDYARAKAIIAFGIHTHLLDRWKRQIGTSKPKSRQAIDASISEVLRGHNREKNPSAVNPKQGWCPVHAGRFLEPFGLTTGDYHQLDGEWFAASPPKEINKGLIPDNIAYYVEGDEKFADTLRITLNVNTQEDPKSSEAYFSQIGSALINKATQQDIDVQKMIDGGHLDKCCQFGGERVRITKELFPNQKNGGYSLRLSIEKAIKPPSAGS